MEGKNLKVRKQEKVKGCSSHQGEENYFNNMLSRDSIVGHSSRDSYCLSPGGVPFKWEHKPGTPKINPRRAEEEYIPTPPASPAASQPPLIQSQGLSKSCNWLIEPPPPPVGCMLPSDWLQKKFKKFQRSISNVVPTSGMRKGSPRIADSNRKTSSSNASSSSSSSVLSSNTSSSSSSSLPSALSLSGGNGRGVEKDQEDGSATCILGWNKTKILVRVTRRN